MLIVANKSPVFLVESSDITKAYVNVQGRDWLT